MKRLMLVLALILMPKIEAAEPCLTPGTDYLALEFIEFDQTMDAGWREVANREGCKAAAAELIKKYRTTHSQ